MRVSLTSGASGCADLGSTAAYHPGRTGVVGFAERSSGLDVLEAVASWATPAQARSAWSAVRAEIIKCSRTQGTVKGHRSSVSINPLALPTVGSASAGYKVAMSGGGGLVVFDEDIATKGRGFLDLVYGPAGSNQAEAARILRAAAALIRG